MKGTGGGGGQPSHRVPNNTECNQETQGYTEQHERSDGSERRETQQVNQANRKYRK